MTDNDLQQRIKEIEDRIAIKNIVDTFSILADQKDIRKQVLLFAEDGTVENFANGQPGTKLSGRKQIADAFAAFLSNFETVYHLNGQQTLTLQGDRASGISYCAVTLIGSQNGKKIKTSMGVYYHDDFARTGGHWLIAKRVSTFAWQNSQPLGQP
jgi:SnoaL-like domain